MDSPELQYLKAMHEKNKKFYQHALLELANQHALLAVLTETVKSDIVLRRGYDQESFEAEFQSQLTKSQKVFQDALSNRLNQDTESESETN